MHCVSCEVLLEKEFKKVKGFQSCKISHKKGSADIACADNVPLVKLEEAVKACGYSLSEKPEKAQREKPDYFEIGLIVMVLGVVFWVLKALEISRFFPNFGADAGIAVALLLGIVASLSTCLALVGGIVMSFGSVVEVEDNKKNHFLARALPHIYFHIGRVGGFALLGGLLGLIGSKITYSLSFTGYLTIVIAVVMFYIGLQVLNIVPNISELGFHLPKWLSKPLHNLEGKDGHFTPIAIGALTFFLPCGFTQSMQLAAVGSGSFTKGALIMAVFALGTLPVLFSVGVGSTYANQKKFGFFHRVIGVVLIFFAFYSFSSGFTLTGLPGISSFQKSGAQTTSAEITDDVQVVKMDVDWVYKPSEFRIKKGVPVRWEINGVNVSGCSNEIVVPSMNISKKLNSGMNIIEFTPKESGVLPFSCWMGMIRGKFIVE